MKKTLVHSLFFIFLFQLNFTFTETISVAADPWMPFTGNEKKESAGYLIDLLRAVFEPQGITIEYKLMPWSRSVEEARKGTLTAIAGAYKSDAPDFIFSRKPQGILQDCFFVMKGSPWKFKDITSLESISLGITNGYSYGESIDAYIEKNKANPKRIQCLSGEDTLSQNLLKLQKGRIDVLLEGNSVVYYKLKKDRLDLSLERAGLSEPHEIFIAFSPKNPRSSDYARKLDEGIDRVRQSGKLKEILDTYETVDWAK